MNLARTDIRFVLPVPATTAAVLGTAPGWAAQLQQLGLAADGARPELAITGSSRVATAVDADAVIVTGDGRRAIRARGWHPTALLSLPDAESPAVLVPYGQPRAARYALGTWISPARRWKAARNLGVAVALAAGRRPPGTAIVTVGASEPGPPFMIGAAEALGVPRDVEWFLVPGQGDALTRGVFFLLGAGAAHPSWVLKFSRSEGRADPFVRDAAGLDLAAQAGGSVAAHAPRLLGRLQVAGFEASVETAAPGRSLIATLTGSDSRRRKLEVVERIAAWTVALGRQTVGQPSALAAERERLRTEVLPSWSADPALLDGLDGLAPILQHNDLGTWNIYTSRHDFSVLDWESARERGLPLWDLLYFLADALAHVDGASSLLERREEYVLRLFRGELPSSALLFAWVRRGAAAGGIPDEAVGRVALLGMLHHGRSWVQRGADVRAHDLDVGEDPWLALLRRLAGHWLVDPALGAGWNRWRA